mmetsp:Transcript_11866/g.21463  ORF Transcript_11866/g.21463 Transcript_11866/m.21463 type:complete len:482 (-) Transcript_11866:1799-3244(-)
MTHRCISLSVFIILYVFLVSSTSANIQLHNSNNNNNKVIFSNSIPYSISQSNSSNETNNNDNNSPDLQDALDNPESFSYWDLGWFVHSWWPGIILCIIGSFLLNLGTNIMKVAINSRLELPLESRKRLSQMPQWIVGFALFILGTLLNFASFKFAAQSLLSGLSSVQFVSQMFFSKFILHERVDSLAYVGVLAILLGSTLLVFFGQHQNKNYGPEELAALYGRAPYVCYLITTSALSCLAWIVYNNIKRKVRQSCHPPLEIFSLSAATNQQKYSLALLYALRTGIWGAYAVTLAKSLSMLLSQLVSPIPEHINPLYTPETYFILLAFVASAVYRLVRLNQALKMFDAVYMVPMLNIAWILFASVGGGIYYEEFADWGIAQYGMYVFGFCTILGGVVLLCPREQSQQPVTQAEAIYGLVQRGEDDEQQHLDMQQIHSLGEVRTVKSTGSSPFIASHHGQEQQRHDERNGKLDGYADNNGVNG